MKKKQRDLGLPKRALCGCLTHTSKKAIQRFINYPKVDLVEWRLDFFIRERSVEEAVDALSFLGASPRRGVIATNRPDRIQGGWTGPEDARMDILTKAVRAGAEWVDVEHDAAPGAVRHFQSLGAKTVLSFHDFDGTPDQDVLYRHTEEMARTGAEVIKIATYAKTGEDTLRVLELIPFAQRRFGAKMIAFCMGPLGSWSRLVCLLLGSPWTYAQLPGSPAAAPDQLTASEMRALLKNGRWDLDVRPARKGSRGADPR